MWLFPDMLHWMKSIRWFANVLVFSLLIKCFWGRMKGLHGPDEMVSLTGCSPQGIVWKHMMYSKSKRCIRSYFHNWNTNCIFVKYWWTLSFASVGFIDPVNSKLGCFFALHSQKVPPCLWVCNAVHLDLRCALFDVWGWLSFQINKTMK